MPFRGCDKLCDRRTGVNDCSLCRVEAEVGIARVDDGDEALFDDGAQRFEGGAAQSAPRQRFACCFGVEDEAFEMADRMTADQDFA